MADAIVRFPANSKRTKNVEFPATRLTEEEVRERGLFSDATLTRATEVFLLSKDPNQEPDGPRSPEDWLGAVIVFEKRNWIPSKRHPLSSGFVILAEKE